MSFLDATFQTKVMSSELFDTTNDAVNKIQNHMINQYKQYTPPRPFVIRYYYHYRTAEGSILHVLLLPSPVP
jgi:hypothetical protein